MQFRCVTIPAMQSSDLLRSRGLKDTQPRRLVLDAFRVLNGSASAQELWTAVDGGGHAVNRVTVYRVLDALRTRGLVHQHPCDGRFSLCSLPDAKGHHGFLHCTACGTTEEFVSSALCRVEDAIAAEHRFAPSGHVSEILGTCNSCS